MRKKNSLRLILLTFIHQSPVLLLDFADFLVELTEYQGVPLLDFGVRAYRLLRLDPVRPLGPGNRALKAPTNDFRFGDGVRHICLERALLGQLREIQQICLRLFRLIGLMRGDKHPERLVAQSRYTLVIRNVMRILRDKGRISHPVSCVIWLIH